MCIFCKCGTIVQTEFSKYIPGIRTNLKLCVHRTVGVLEVGQFAIRRLEEFRSLILCHWSVSTRICCITNSKSEYQRQVSASAVSAYNSKYFYRSAKNARVWVRAGMCGMQCIHASFLLPQAKKSPLPTELGRESCVYNSILNFGFYIFMFMMRMKAGWINFLHFNLAYII